MNGDILKEQGVMYLNIAADQAGQRIDNFLHTHLKGVPRSHVYRILRTGEVRVNRGRTRPTYRLQTGDVLRLPPIVRQENVPIVLSHDTLARLSDAILHEDAYLLVLNKPAGMAVHGGSGLQYGVIEGLRALFPEQRYLELVHRLDRDTSGCLMVAKKPAALRQIHALLREGHNPQMQKNYQALVAGRWSRHMRSVDLPLRKNTLQSGERIVRVDAEGKPSLTAFRIRQSFTEATLLDVEPITGRTHQIRVHTARAGHAVAGDEKYGHDDFNHHMQQAYGLKRLFLHAISLQLHLPALRYRLSVTAPLPDSLQQVLQALQDR